MLSLKNYEISKVLYQKTESLLESGEILENEKLFIDKEILNSTLFDLHFGRYLNKIVQIKSYKASQNQTFYSEKNILELTNCKEIIKPVLINTQKCQLVLNYYRIGSLKELIHSRIPVLTTKLKSNLSLEIAKTMKYLHSLNIIHRELTPSNILIKNITKNTLKIKLTNFHSAIKAQTYIPYFQSSQPIYSSPELLANRKCGLKTDVYSFGVVLWELFTKQHPFKGEDINEVQYNIINKNYRPDTSLITSKNIKEIIENCLEPDPNLRPSFSQITTSLKNLI